MAGETKWDQSKFSKTLKEYVRVSKRSVADALNIKAFFIARRAVNETPKADKLAIGKSLSAALFSFQGKSNRRTLKTVTQYDRYGRTYQVPLAALIINARRKARGKPGLQGDAMKAAVKNLIGHRQRAVGFLKSGWLNAVRLMEYAVPSKYRRGAPPADTSFAATGAPKGTATPAVPGSKPVARIENNIGLGGPDAAAHNAALHKYGEPALARAFTFETLGMQQYIDQHLKPDADEFNSHQR